MGKTSCCVLLVWVCVSWFRLVEGNGLPNLVWKNTDLKAIQYFGMNWNADCAPGLITLHHCWNLSNALVSEWEHCSLLRSSKLPLLFCAFASGLLIPCTLLPVSWNPLTCLPDILPDPYTYGSLPNPFLINLPVWTAFRVLTLTCLMVL